MWPLVRDFSEHDEIFRQEKNTEKFGTCHFTIIERNIKADFRELFSSLRFDLGEIFETIIFSRGPKNKYCTARRLLRD